MSRQTRGRAHWALVVVVALVLGLVAVKHASKRADETRATARAVRVATEAEPGRNAEPEAASISPAAGKPAPSASGARPGPGLREAGAGGVHEPRPQPPGTRAVKAPAGVRQRRTLPASPPPCAQAETAELRKPGEGRLPAEPLPGASFDESLKSGRPTMADFGAGWCKPCKMMVPVLAEAAGRYEGKVNILFVDTDGYAPLAREHRVAAIPTQIFFDGKGKEVGRHVGYYPIEDLDAQLRSLGLIE